MISPGQIYISYGDKKEHIVDRVTNSRPPVATLRCLDCEIKNEFPVMVSDLEVRISRGLFTLKK
jgi:hypothetical protein